MSSTNSIRWFLFEKFPPNISQNRPENLIFREIIWFCRKCCLNYVRHLFILDSHVFHRYPFYKKLTIKRRKIIKKLWIPNRIDRVTYKNTGISKWNPPIYRDHQSPWEPRQAPYRHLQLQGGSEYSDTNQHTPEILWKNSGRTLYRVTLRRKRQRVQY